MPHGSGVRRVGAALVALAAGSGLAVWGTWPLATCLASCVAEPPGKVGLLAAAFRRDIDLTMWILAWGAHALVTDPRTVFDANIFHPAPDALATTEHMLGLQPIYLPLALATHDAVFAHQATLLATFVGAFLTMLALVHAWTGSWTGGVVAGVLYAYNPFRASYLTALQVEAAWLLPLVVLATERAGSRRAPCWAVVLAVTLTCQALSCYYLGYAAFITVAVLVLFVIAADPRARRRAALLAGAIVGAAVVVAACSVPYLLVRAGGAFARPDPDFVAWASARPGKTGAPFALAAAIATLPWWRRGLCRCTALAWPLGLAAAGLVGHLLALGPAVPVGPVRLPGPFALAAVIVPGWHVVRAPERLNVIATLAVAVMAGVGIAGVVRAAATRRAWAGRVVAAGAILAAVASVRVTMPCPVAISPADTADRIPTVYAWLAHVPEGPVLEVPFHDFWGDVAGRDVEARRQLRSIHHWHPLLGGYSGYVPRTYAPVSALARALPDPRALDLLVRTTGLRWIIVHRRELDRDARRRWAAAGGSVRPVAVLGPDLVLVPRARPPADLEGLLVRDAGTTTPLGTPLVPLAAPNRRAVVAIERPPRSVSRFEPTEVAVRVRNVGRVAWPGMGAHPTHLVTLAYRWSDPNTGLSVSERVDAGRLPWDIQPGDTVEARVVVMPPPPAASVMLTIAPAQDGVWFGGGAVMCVGDDARVVDCATAAARAAGRSPAPAAGPDDRTAPQRARHPSRD